MEGSGMTDLVRAGRYRQMILTIAMLGITAVIASAAEPSVKPIHASKIVLVGDSTVSVQSGWGGSFCAVHVTATAACVNLARPGRSSGSYLAEGSWELALAEARTPGFKSTWILIQFGHNDQPGKPGRSTDLATEFPANLRRYVNEARTAGAKPVLITPLARRLFSDGKLKNSLEPWAAAAISVAAEMNVPLIDLNARSSAAIQAMGLTAANEFAPAPPSPEVAAAAAKGNSTSGSTGATTPEGNEKPKSTFDFTHLGRKGADYFSAMVVEELANKVPEMRPLLIP
jgi:lysophospholipase L1-like esterase